MFSYRDHSEKEVEAYKKKAIKESVRKEEIWKNRVKRHPDLLRASTGLKGRYVGPGGDGFFR